MFKNGNYLRGTSIDTLGLYLAVPTTHTPWVTPELVYTNQLPLVLSKCSQIHLHSQTSSNLSSTEIHPMLIASTEYKQRKYLFFTHSKLIQTFTLDSFFCWKWNSMSAYLQCTDCMYVRTISNALNKLSLWLLWDKFMTSHS